MKLNKINIIYKLFIFKFKSHKNTGLKDDLSFYIIAMSRYDFLMPNTKIEFLNMTLPASNMIRSKDWSKTPLGDINKWDPNLKTYVQFILNSNQPSFLTWGDERTFIPNSAMAPILKQSNETTLESSIGKTHAQISKKHWTEIEPTLLKVKNGESATLENFHVTEEDGGQQRHFYYSLTYTPLFDSNNINSGVMCTITENTSLFEIHEELRIAKDAAERASVFKTNFLANMSHEIRTPLGVLLGFADLIDKPDTSAAERANYIEIMKRNGDQLNGIINDVLDLSKVETGHMDVELKPIKTDAILEEVVSIMSVPAKNKSLALNVRKDSDYPEVIVGDPTKIKQVLINLLGNAIKFTTVGSIDISLSNWEEAGELKGCKIQVSDTGVGIDKDKKDRLFKRFSQIDESITRKFGGTGIGLALSKSLAKLMDGDVVLEETASGKGSTFTFYIGTDLELIENDLKEIEFQGVDSKKEFSRDALKGKHLLLVEDSPDNQRLIWNYLSAFGASVDFANNGAEGLEKAPNGNYDLVLMDLQMPVMDGYTSVEKLRSKSYDKPIVALTAHALMDVKKKCLEAGFSAHLTKPIKINTMLDTIIRLTT